MALVEAATRSALLRIALRASLLGGALADLVMVALQHVYVGLVLAPTEAISVYTPALLARSAVQALACYDRERFDPLIPLVALTLLLSPLARPSLIELLLAAIGLAQLVLWRLTRS